MIIKGFCGSAGTVRSRNVNSERTRNWMVATAPGHPKVDPWLCPTPCVRPFVVLPEGPIRALFAQDGRLFAVAGASFYEVFPSQTYALRGTAVSDGKPATISSTRSLRQSA